MKYIHYNAYIILAGKNEMVLE